MISYKEAQDIIKSHALSLDKELINIDDACGRVLAEDIVAERDFPPFNRSAMDGIAIRAEDFHKGIRDFRIVETIFAGQNHINGIA
jgi:molybdopterin molybdotransferase